MIKKIFLTTAVALPMIFGTKVSAFEFPEKFPIGEISANVGYYSQYVWRGEQQNTGQSAIQGGFDWGMTLLDTYVDTYAGVWGSNVAGTTNTLSGNELDYYLGFSGAVPGLEDFLSYDGGFLYYDYPGMTDAQTADGAANNDFLEYYASLGVAVPVNDIGLGFYYGYSPTGFGGAYGYNYMNISAEVPIPGTPLTLSGGAGFTGVDTEGGNQYTDYIASVSTSAFGLDFALSYTTIEGYTTDVESNQIIWSMGAGF